MSSNKILTHYVSEIDQVLEGFDRKYPGLSLSQQKEKAKLQRIYALRDGSVTEKTPSDSFWKDFQ